MKTIVYVKGTVRKDAVEIIPKEVRVPEARVLEVKYGEAWVPVSVREVSIEDDQYPDANAELDRLAAHYGPEVVNEAFGTAIQARKDVSELLSMTTAQAVKDSGVIPEVAGPLDIEKAPEKGTKAFAQAQADKAGKDGLKPTVVKADADETEEVEEDSLENLTKAELQAKLDEKDIAYPASANKAALIELLNSGD
jgi:hypothetical protein